MPYIKGTKSRRTVKRPYRKGKKLNLRQKREVKRIVGVRQESKYFSAGAAFFNITATPGFTQLALVPQGVADGQRVGDSIRLRKLDLRLQALVGDYYNTIRVIVFRFNAPSGVAPTTAETFDASASGAEYVLCPIPAQQKEKKYHILLDKVFQLSAQVAWSSAGTVNSLSSAPAPGVSSSVKHSRHILYGKRIGTKTIKFDAGATTTSTGSIWICYVSDSGFTPYPALYYNARLTYSDS